MARQSFFPSCVSFVPRPLLPRVRKTYNAILDRTYYSLGYEFVQLDEMFDERPWPSWTSIYGWTRAWTRIMKEHQDIAGVTRSEEVPADGLSSINKTDLPKYIENYATIVESNLKEAEIMSREFAISLFVTCSLKEKLNTLRCKFNKTCQEMHQYSLNRETLIDILYELQEVNICTVELLQNFKNVAKSRGCAKWPLSTSQLYFVQSLNDVLYLIIDSVNESIIKLNRLMQANLKYAESVMYNILSLIIALLLFICQSSLESATDMKQLMIFATVIHLIISGDVESNPGPEYDPRDLYKKEPEVDDFQRIVLQSGAACHCHIIGRALGVDVNDLVNCPLSAADMMIGVVHKRWSDKHVDFTWERLLEACEGYDQLGRVYDAIDEFLSSHEAHETYGDKPEFKSKRSRMSKNDYSNKTDNGPVHVHVHVHERTCIPTSVLIFIIIFLCAVIIYQWTDDKNC